jgi:adenine-specific DNA-methyltransferase
MNEVPGPSSTQTTPPSEANLEAFKSLFPGVIQDGALDAVRLGELLDTPVSGVKEGKERFGLMWAGKKRAVEALQTPSMAALVPDKEASINWDTAENVFIEGDNLEVLKLLQKAYNDQVKLIYIDPPYNTGNDFVYNDDFSDPLQHYLEVTGQVDAEGNRLVANAETAGRKHSNWLTMMYPRLVLARNLLTQDGAIFISIDDNEVGNLRLLMDEVFGAENFVACITWHKTYSTRNDAQEFSKSHEYLLVYKRSIWNRKLLPRSEKSNAMYRYDDGDGRGTYRTDNLTASRSGETDAFPVTNPNTGKVYTPGQGLGWRHSKARFQELLQENRIYWGKDGNGAPQLKRYLSEVQDGVIPTTIWHYDEVGHTDKAAKEVKDLLGGGIFDYPKPLDLISRVIQLGMGPDDIVMDFFAGSGTTGHAAMLANAADGGNRKYILVTLDEPTGERSGAFAAGYKTVSEITLARLKAAMQKVPGAADKGIRKLKLGASSFHVASARDEEAIFALVEKTVAESSSRDSITSQLSLALGELLSIPWQVTSCGGESAVRIGSVLVVPATMLNQEIIDDAFASGANSVVFLEDAFEGNDSLKANAFYRARTQNLELKTF